MFEGVAWTSKCPSSAAILDRTVARAPEKPRCVGGDGDVDSGLAVRFSGERRCSVLGPTQRHI